MSEKQREIAIIFGLGITAAISFLPVLRAEFTIWDDNHFITENPYLVEGFRDGLMPLLTHARSSLYVPVTFTLWWAQRHLWGLNPFGFHLVNLLIHVAGVAVVYLIFRRLLPGMFPAWIAALWWGVHPLHVESVAWASMLKDLLSALLALVSLLLYMAWRDDAERSFRESRPWRWVVSLIIFLLACLSKPGVVAFPIVLVAYERVIARRNWWNLWATLPYFAVSALIIVITMNVQRPEEQGIQPPSVLERMYLVGDSSLFYMQKATWPAGLSPVYGRTIQEVVSSGWRWIRPIAVGVIYALALFMGRRWALGAVIFIAGFAPVSGVTPFLYQGHSTVADHYVYFSLVGLALILGDLASRLSLMSADRLKGWRSIVAGGTILWVLLFGVLTWIQTEVWRDSVTIWQRVVKMKPGWAEGYLGRGNAWRAKGLYDRAIKDYTSAIELLPGLADAFNYRGAARVAQGEYDSAIEDYTSAIELAPRNADAWNNRGAAWGAKGRYGQAVEDCSRALELKENFAAAYGNRGVARTNLDDPDGAINDFDSAIRLDPSSAKTYYGRAAALRAKGDYDGAIRDYTEAIRLNPGYAKAYYSRGGVSVEKREYADAIRDFTEALELKPDYLEAYNDRSNVWSITGNFGRAVQDCASVIKIEPAYSDAYHNRAVAYYGMKKYEEAWADIKRCRELGGTIEPAIEERLKKVAPQSE